MLIGATLHPRFDLIMKYFRLDELMQDCDLVITAEGGIDYQTPRGKIPSEVARRAKKQDLPVVVLAGTVGENAAVNYKIGIDAFVSIMQSPTTLENAINEAERLLIEGAESAMRMITIGSGIRKSSETRRSSRSSKNSNKSAKSSSDLTGVAVKLRTESMANKPTKSLLDAGREYWRLRIRGRYNWRP